MQDNHDYYVKGNFITRDHIKQTFLKNNITRYIAYFFQSTLFTFLIIINKLLKKQKKEYKYTICICGIFRNEGKYLDEWIKFHLLIGVEHFYLYNNNKKRFFIYNSNCW